MGWVRRKQAKSLKRGVYVCVCVCARVRNILLNIFYKIKHDLKGYSRSHMMTFFSKILFFFDMFVVSNQIASKLKVNANIIKTQFYSLNKV